MNPTSQKISKLFIKMHPTVPKKNFKVICQDKPYFPKNFKVICQDAPYFSKKFQSNLSRCTLLLKKISKSFIEGTLPPKKFQSNLSGCTLHPKKNCKVICRKAPYTPKNFKVIHLLKRNFKKKIYLKKEFFLKKIFIKKKNFKKKKKNFFNFFFLKSYCSFLGNHLPTTFFWESHNIQEEAHVANFVISPMAAILPKI